MRDNLILTTGVTFGKGADQGKFRMVAYTGAPVDRYFGKLAIDIDGIKSKTQMPIFRQHEHTAIVGHSNKVYKKDGAFVVEGKFSDTTSTAREVRALAAEGFPWQASIGVSPKKKIEIKPGASVSVNGRSVSGPAEVWLESEVYEVSFVPLGADGGTSVATFATSSHSQEDPLKGMWNQSPQLQNEFSGDFETFKHYQQAKAKGLCHIVGATCTSYTQEDFK